MQYTPGQPLTVPQIATAFVEGHPIFVDGGLQHPRWISAQRVGYLLELCHAARVAEAVSSVAWSGNVPVDSL